MPSSASLLLTLDIILDSFPRIVRRFSFLDYFACMPVLTVRHFVCENSIQVLGHFAGPVNRGCDHWCLKSIAGAPTSSHTHIKTLARALAIATVRLVPLCMGVRKQLI